MQRELFHRYSVRIGALAPVILVDRKGGKRGPSRKSLRVVKGTGIDLRGPRSGRSVFGAREWAAVGAASRIRDRAHTRVQRTRQNDDVGHHGPGAERHVGRLGPRRDPVRDTPSLVSRKRETLDEKLPWPAIAIK